MRAARIRPISAIQLTEENDAHDIQLRNWTFDIADDATVHAQLDKPAMIKILQTIDDRQRNGGDYKALATSSRKNKEMMVYESVIYRRDEDDELMILFLRPKAEAGKGYLRLDKNHSSTIPPLANGSDGRTRAHRWHRQQARLMNLIGGGIRAIVYCLGKAWKTKCLPQVDGQKGC